MNKEEFGLKDLVKDFGYFHVKIDKKFLKDLLIKASKNSKPHYNKEFIMQLGMNFTKGKECCLTIYGWTTYEKTIPLEKLAKIVEMTKTDWKEVESKIKFIRCGQRGGEINPIFPIKIEKRLGSIIGHILGDGSIDQRFQQMSFSNSDKDLLKEFADNMISIFGVEPRIWMQKQPYFGNTSWDKKLTNIDELLEGRNCSLFYPRTCSLILNNIFNNFAIGKKKNLTKEILEANKQFKAGLIKAFYDDEGSVDKISYIRVFQDRKDMLELFRKLLEEFKISSTKVFTYIKGNKERYYFNIHRKTNFIKFQREIGFTSPKKASKLDYLVTIRNQKNSM